MSATRRTCMLAAACLALVVPCGVAVGAPPARPDARPLQLAAASRAVPRTAVPRLLRGPGAVDRYRALPRSERASAAALDVAGSWRALRAARRPAGAQSARSDRIRLAASLKNRRIASQRD
ncbi:MAG: hypothetical protein Kow0062_24140 [Acidobacteriota bacterium]